MAQFFWIAWQRKGTPAQEILGVHESFYGAMARVAKAIRANRPEAPISVTLSDNGWRALFFDHTVTEDSPERYYDYELEQQQVLP